MGISTAFEGFEYNHEPNTRLLADESLDFVAAAEVICKCNPNYGLWPQFKKRTLKKGFDRIKVISCPCLFMVIEKLLRSVSSVLY